ncbi:MAG: hypothetical protein H0U79_04815 [Solirubrobacterales bacterium]|nr:hypothetical protein [Solirubrobacterales bacterium]
MTIRVGARRFTHHEFIADRDELELWLGPPRLLARPRLASTPEGHELGYGDDGNFLGQADVAAVIAAA